MFRLEFKLKFLGVYTHIIYVIVVSNLIISSFFTKLTCLLRKV